MRISGIAGAMLVSFLVLAVSPARAMEGRTHAVPGIRVYVGNHLMHINCVGHGTPTVVLDSGLGGTSLDWVFVQPEIARHTRVCAYDRAGYGWSDTSSRPRTSLNIAEELHMLLKVAHIPGPYVLVGHSFGGFNARLFASLYPGDTAGLVLIDAANERQFVRFEEADMHVSTAPRGRNFVLFAQAPPPPKLPPELQPIARALASAQSTMVAVRGELASFRQSAEQVAHAPPLPDVPIAVITRGKRVWPRNERGDQMEKLWMELQDELAHLNPHAVHLIAENSGHYVQLEQPAVVINAIHVIVESARAPLRNLSHLMGEPFWAPEPVRHN